MALTRISVTHRHPPGGIFAGAGFVTSPASRREHRAYSMRGPVPSRLARGARVLSGLYVGDVVSVSPCR